MIWGESRQLVGVFKGPPGKFLCNFKTNKAAPYLLYLKQNLPTVKLTAHATTLGTSSYCLFLY